MRPTLRDGEVVFLAVSALGWEAVADAAIGHFREDEGVTVILLRQDADRRGLQYDYVCRMITLTVHSSLTAVGFLAVVAARLAAAGISANAVSAVYHDHLFVPAERADDAVRALRELAEESR